MKQGLARAEGMRVNTPQRYPRPAADPPPIGQAGVVKKIQTVGDKQQVTQLAEGLHFCHRNVTQPVTMRCY